MTDLLAARSQMAMSLAFHIIFAAIGIAMPLLMIIAVFSAAAPRITLQLLLAALVAGAILLFPSYYYLFRIFKSQPQKAQKAQINNYTHL